MNIRLLTFLVFVVLCAVESLQSADWPTFAGNNARVATTDEKLELPLVLRWQYNSPAAPQTAFAPPRDEPIEGQYMRHRVKFDDALQVVAAGGRAFFGSQVDHQVRCVEVDTGKLIWKFYTEAAVRLAPTIDGGRVYFGSDDGYVYCLDATDGKLIWKTRPSPRDDRLLARGQLISRWPIRTGVLVDDGVAYFGAGVFPHETVYVCAVDAETGEFLWKNDRISQQDAQRNDLSPQGYLLANDKLLFVPSGRALPVAFDRKTGEIVHGRKHAWRTTAGGVVGGTSALLGDGQIYASGPHHFLAMGQKDGAVGHSWMKGRQMTLVGDDALIATGEHLIRVNRKEHAAASIKRQELFLKLRKVPSQLRKGIEEERERLAKVGIAWSAITTHDGALTAAGNTIFTGGNGEFSGFSAETGEPEFTYKVDGEVRGIAVAHGMVLVSTTAGKVYAYGQASHTPAKWQVRHLPAKPQLPKVDEKFVKQAEQILKTTGVHRGFCLVNQSESGQLAYELARQSDLVVYGYEDDEELLDTSRELLGKAGLYGHRVALFEHGEGLPNYFANLVVTEYEPTSKKQVPFFFAQARAHIKPLGGKVCLIGEDYLKIAEDVLDTKEFTVKNVDGITVATRDKLPGAGQWSHQYGDVGNTNNSHDQLVKGGLGVLWYGDPGPGRMINRHEAAVAPLSTGGRMFVQGTDTISAWDSYNGLFLWERDNPGAIRTGVFNNEDCSNLAASDDSLFVVAGDTCTQHDAATGKVIREHKIPAVEKADEAIERVWGYVAAHDGLLYGTTTIRSELRRELRRRGRKVQQASDGVFAIDLKTGERKWAYTGKNVMHQTIAIDGGRVYFIDSTITSDEREAFLREDKSKLEALTGKEKEAAEKELKRRDVRLAVALDSQTGEMLWSKPVDVTDMSHLAIGGGQMTLMATDGKVVICGANANGHYWRQFLAGEFNQRRLLVLDGKTGEKLWSKDANYRSRPIVVEDKVLAEPWAFDLASGKEIERLHPVTGEPTPWMFSRPGHHCGPISASPNMLLFRSGFTGYYDLYEDSGTRHFAGQRLGCWVNAIPGNGLVMIPEASAGCVCLFPIAATVVLEPKENRSSWGIYSTHGARTPVKKLAINLGAPGDRRDEDGRLWLAYPRPKTVGRLEYTFNIDAKLADGGQWFSGNAESVSVEGDGVDWVYSSGAKGFQRCEIPILGKDDDPADYTVTLRLTQLGETKPGEASFDIKLNGEVVARDVDPMKEAGGPAKKMTRVFTGVTVEKNLVVEFVPKGSGEAEPSLLGGIEVTRE